MKNIINDSIDTQIAAKKRKFKRTAISTCVATALFGMNAAQLSAQEQTEATNQNAKETVLEEVVVTGFRRSIKDSIDNKRFSESVIEAITAEDIGKLPDSSIADSIARLPGLAAQRLDGRASSISVRGFSEDFSTATFNGREQVSIDDNRGVQFDLYPSEIISGVTVHKTPTSSLVNQGIASTIDLQTIRPLSQDERLLVLNASYEQNDIGKLNADGEDAGFRGTLSFVDKFADDKLGVALALSTFESPNNEERFNAWGYPTDANGNSVLGGLKPFVRSSNLQRDTAMAVVEYAPTENLSITADALYIDFLDEKILRGIEIPGAIWGGGFGTEFTPGSASNGFITSGSLDNVTGVVRNDFEQRDAELRNVGLNIKYDINESTVLEFDVSSSEAERTINSLETYSGTGRGTGVGATDTIGFQMPTQQGITLNNQLNYADPNLVRLGGPLSWANGITVPSNGQDGFINIPEIEDELTALRVSLSKDFESGFITNVEVGVNYTDRSKSKEDNGFFLTLRDFPNQSAVPEAFRVAPTSLEFLGLGSQLSYDAFGLFNSGIYTQTSENLTVNTRLINTWTVDEEITTAYGQINFATELGSMNLSGNVGLQYVDTDQSSMGNAVTSQDGFSVPSASTGGASFDHLLPSLNLNLDITDNHKLRFGYAQTISRSRMDRMNAGFGFSFDPVANIAGAPAFSGGGGNPELRPNEANSYDLSYEWYFSDEGYLAVAYFYKDLKSWQEQVQSVVDLSGLQAPGFNGVINNPTGLITQWTDNTTGSLDGFEISGVLPGNIISPALDGFGISMSATFLDSSLESGVDGSSLEIPGLSEEILNATFFYEKNGFSVRASVRDREDFLGERFGNSFVRESTTVVGSTIWDAQIGFDFGEAGIERFDGLAISLQGQNLTDEPFTTLDGNGFIRDFQRFGRTFLLNARYSF